MKKQSTFKKNITNIVTIVCLGVFLYAAHGLTTILFDYYKNQKELSAVQEIYESESNKTAAMAKSKKIERSTDDQPEVRPEFNELLEENDETTGWLTIDDTNIDYPIVQSDDNSFYMDKGFYKEDAIAGSLFLDYRNDIRDSSERNHIIYGHRVKDGSMFEDLTKYLDEDFFKAQQTFTFDTLYDEYEVEVFAVYNTLVYFNYIQTDFESDEEYEELLSKMREKSIYETDVEVDADDQILTLSTCEYTLDPDDSRLVIHGKLTKK